MRLALAALRTLGVALVAALALNATVGAARPLAPLVALDVSASWLRGGDSTAYRRALDESRRSAADTLWLVGDSVRAATGAVRDVVPLDLASGVAPLVDHAAASGRALVLYTDGEVEGGEALRTAPRGSRVADVTVARRSDVAVRDVEVPRLAAATDTIEVRATLVADARGAPAGVLSVHAGDRATVERPFDALGAYAERTVALRVPLAGLRGETVLRTIVAAVGDAEPRNDTVSTALDVSAAPAAVYVATAPDYDTRAVLGVLRGALALPTRAFLRVAPGQWRVEGTLAPVPESEVRRLAATAGILGIQGDTTVFGPPRSLSRGALLLFPTTANTESGEWYASDAPPSPASAALSGAAWDSLPPLDVGGPLPTTLVDVLRARLGRAGAPRTIAALVEQPRRVAIVGATGFWRWSFRGGVAADAFTGLWGALFDFLAAGRGDQRAAVAADAVVRAGAPVRWRRGGTDTLVTAVATRRSDARVDTLTIAFGPASDIATSRPLAAGVYDVRTTGGTSLLVVNAARELLPRRPSVRPGAVGGASVADATPRARDLGWLYAAALGLLCAEWVFRRRAGLR